MTCSRRNEHFLGLRVKPAIFLACQKLEQGAPNALQMSESKQEYHRYTQNRISTLVHVALFTLTSERLLVHCKDRKASSQIYRGQHVL